MSTTTEEVLLSIGSNMNDPIGNCRRSLKLLEESAPLNIVNVSSLYLTEPISPIEQGWFFNYAVQLQTAEEPMELLRLCQQIEGLLGRTREVHWGPRTIDIDIVYFGKRISETKELIIPHPERLKRKFVLVPLNEMVPHFLDPVEDKSIFKLLRELLPSTTDAIAPYASKWY